MNKENDNNELLARLKEVFESLLPNDGYGKYPEEAMKMGTLVRSIKHDRLGVIIDAFYGDVDTTGKKIIIYTLLLTPQTKMTGKSALMKEQYYLTNEYEYDIIGYLMIKRVDVSNLQDILGGGLVL